MKTFGILKRIDNGWALIYVSDGFNQTTTKYFLHFSNVQKMPEGGLKFGTGVDFDIALPRRVGELSRAENAVISPVVEKYKPQAPVAAPTVAPVDPSPVNDGKGGAI